jgi:hypothetical protein
MSYLLFEMGLSNLEWILSILNKNGPIKVNVGINAHLDDPLDELDDPKGLINQRLIMRFYYW